MKKRWISTGGYRGYYEPVPPDGWQLLLDCSIVNNAGIQLRDIVTKWLRKQHVHYKTGILPTTNVFSVSLYIVTEASKIDAGIAADVREWFIEQNNATFSIFSGESYELDTVEAQASFNTLVKEENHE